MTVKLDGRFLKAVLPAKAKKGVFKNNPDHVVVIVQRFLRENHSAVLDLVEKNPQALHPDLHIEQPFTWLFEGVAHDVEWSSGSIINLIKVVDNENKIVIHYRSDAKIVEIQKVFLAFLKKRLLERLNRLMRKWGGSFKASPNIKIKVASKTSSWGSLTRKSYQGSSMSMNMSLYLAFASEAELEYVFIHEMCHSIHFDHSAAFWSEVSSRLPFYKENERILKNISKQLRLQVSLLEDVVDENY